MTTRDRSAGAIVPVILCGGGGTRLWPRSRPAKPKPFLQLTGSTTLFQQALARCANPALFAPAVIVAGAQHLAHVEAQRCEAPVARIVVEPMGRNTAPAIALAALGLAPDAIMLVCPSDHHIADPAAFAAAAETAASLAADDWLVAFGIATGRPETGYGYIRAGEPLGGGFVVDRFVEKPDRATAEVFLADGGYSWNGGIFALRAGAYLAALAEFRPTLHAAVERAYRAGNEQDGCFHPDEAAFASIEGESIDYAVMEHTRRAAMVPVSMGWSDIGNWQALRDVRERDADGNSVRGRAELIDCQGVLVDSDGPRVSAIGLSDVLIVVDGDEVLVTSTEGAARVGTLKGARGQ